MNSEKRLQSWLDAMFRGKRPKRFPASPGELAMMQTAAQLHAAKPGADLPDPAFVERLARRLQNAEAHGVERAVTRRRFVGEGLAVTAAVVAGVGLDEVLHGSAAAAQETLQPDNGTWAEVAKFSELNEATPRQFNTHGVTGYLLKAGNSVNAVSASCTHLGVCVNFDAANGNYWCPCRNAKFKLDGGIVRSGYQAPKPLARIQTRVNGDTVEVRVPY